MAGAESHRMRVRLLLAGWVALALLGTAAAAPWVSSVCAAQENGDKFCDGVSSRPAPRRTWAFWVLAGALAAKLMWAWCGATKAHGAERAR